MPIKTRMIIGCESYLENICTRNTSDSVLMKLKLDIFPKYQQRTEMHSP